MNSFFEKIKKQFFFSEENSKKQKSIYNLPRVSVGNLSRYPNAISEIYTGEMAGIIVEKIFTDTELTNIKKKISQYEHLGFNITWGSILGYPLNKATKHRNKYFEEVQNNEVTYSKIFNLNISDKLTNIFKTISGGRTVGVPIENQQNYNSGTFRLMEVNHGALKAHTGNEFIDLQKERGMSYLTKIANMYDSMSYFVLIQKPEKGELILYDLLYENTLKEVFGFKQNTRNDDYFNTIDSQKLNLQEGDLLVFNGGRIWHKVTDIQGKQRRITFGGFMAISKDDKNIYFWG